jgi:hypothetical protein
MERRPLIVRKRRAYHLSSFLAVDGDALGWWLVSLNLKCATMNCGRESRVGGFGGGPFLTVPFLD